MAPENMAIFCFLADYFLYCHRINTLILLAYEKNRILDAVAAVGSLFPQFGGAGFHSFAEHPRSIPVVGPFAGRCSGVAGRHA